MSGPASQHYYAGDAGGLDPDGNALFPASIPFAVDTSQQGISVALVISKVSGAPAVTLEKTMRDPAVGKFPFSPWLGGIVGGTLQGQGFAAAGGTASLTGTVGVLADAATTASYVNIDVSPILAAPVAANGETLIVGMPGPGITYTYTFVNGTPDPALRQWSTTDELATALASDFFSVAYVAVPSANVVRVTSLYNTYDMTLTGTAADGTGTIQAVHSQAAWVTDRTLISQFPSLEGESFVVSTNGHPNVNVTFGAATVARISDLNTVLAPLGVAAALVGGYLKLSSTTTFFTLAASPALTTLGLAAGSYTQGVPGDFTALAGVASGDAITLTDYAGTSHLLTFGTGGGQLRTVADVNAKLATYTWAAGVAASMDYLGNISFTGPAGRPLGIAGTGGFADLKYVGIPQAAGWAPELNCNGVTITTPVDFVYNAPYKGLRIRVTGGVARIEAAQSGF